MTVFKDICVDFVCSSRFQYKDHSISEMSSISIFMCRGYEDVPVLFCSVTVPVPVQFSIVSGIFSSFTFWTHVVFGTILHFHHDFTAGSWSQGLVVYGDLPPLQQEIQPLQTQCCHRMAVIHLCKYLRISTKCVPDVITSICFILINWLNFSCTVILSFCSLFRNLHTVLNCEETESSKFCVKSFVLTLNRKVYSLHEPSLMKKNFHKEWSPSDYWIIQNICWL